MTYENPWIHNDKIFDSEDIGDAYGMVYLIENTVDGRLYVGKKFFWNKRTKTIKGKKKRYLVESDWKTYYGSSNELQEDVKKLGVDKFNRFVLRLCKDKRECAYYELKEQMDREVLLDENYYNNFVGAKIHGRGFSRTENHE